MKKRLRPKGGFALFFIRHINRTTPTIFLQVNYDKFLLHPGKEAQTEGRICPLLQDAIKTEPNQLP